MINIYEEAKKFKKKYPTTIAWRIKKHATVVENFLGFDEEVKYVFCGQKNDSLFDIISSSVIVITSEKILIGTKRALFGYFYDSISFELFNDIKIYSGFFYGKIIIDTIKEKVTITNLDKKSLREIEDNVGRSVSCWRKKNNIQKKTVS